MQTRALFDDLLATEQCTVKPSSVLSLPTIVEWLSFCTVIVVSLKTLIHPSQTVINLLWLVSLRAYLVLLIALNGVLVWVELEVCVMEQKCSFGVCTARQVNETIIINKLSTGRCAAYRHMPRHKSNMLYVSSKCINFGLFIRCIAVHSIDGVYSDSIFFVVAFV